MKMKKFSMVVLFWLLLAGVCSAQTFEFKLDAGSKSLSAGAHFKSDLGDGYLKAGLSGVLTDDSSTEYKWGAIRVTVGNDTIVEGLRCELGLKGVFGDAEEGTRSGDVAALAFTIHGGYIIPQKVGPVTFEVFSELSYAPELLSFRDTEDYLEGSIGLGVQLIKNATLTVAYTVYDLSMEDGPGDWSLDEGVVRAGILMRF